MRGPVLPRLCSVVVCGWVFSAIEFGVSTQAIRVEKLIGDEARAYLSQKIASRPDVAAAFAASAAEMESRGFKSTGVVVVVRGYRAPTTINRALAVLRGLAEPAVHAQQISDGENEVIWTSWDDGDDGTWEGSEYWEWYADGYWQLTNQQSDITSDERVLWAHLAGSRDGRERTREGPEPDISGLVMRDQQQYAAFSTAAGARCSPAFSLNGLSPTRVTHDDFKFAVFSMSEAQEFGTCGCNNTFWNRLCLQQEIAACNIERCAPSLLYCWRSGVRYRECVINACGVTAFQCVRDANRFYRQRCGY